MGTLVGVHWIVPWLKHNVFRHDSGNLLWRCIIDRWCCQFNQRAGFLEFFLFKRVWHTTTVIWSCYPSYVRFECLGNSSEIAWNCHTQRAGYANTLEVVDLEPEISIDFHWFSFKKKTNKPWDFGIFSPLLMMCFQKTRKSLSSRRDLWFPQSTSLHTAGVLDTRLHKQGVQTFTRCGTVHDKAKMVLGVLKVGKIGWVSFLRWFGMSRWWIRLKLIESSYVRSLSLIEQWTKPWLFTVYRGLYYPIIWGL